MAAATLNGRAKMRGLRYLKSCSQAPTAAVHGGKPLWTVALGALTGDSRYESSTHPSTAPCTVTSELPVAPRLVPQLPVAGTGRGETQPVGTRCLFMGRWERIRVRMNIFERRTANRAFSLGTSPITNVLSKPPCANSLWRIDVRGNLDTIRGNAGTIDSDNRENRWHCIRVRLDRNMMLIYDHLLRRINTGKDNSGLPADSLGAEPVQLAWSIHQCQHRSFCYASFACDIFEPLHKLCIAHETFATRTLAQLPFSSFCGNYEGLLLHGYRVNILQWPQHSPCPIETSAWIVSECSMSYHASTFNGNISRWQGLLKRSPESAHRYISRRGIFNSSVSGRTGVRPFRVFLSLLSGFHYHTFRPALIPSIVQGIIFGSILFSFLSLFRDFSFGIPIIRAPVINRLIMPAKAGVGSVSAKMVALRKQQAEKEAAAKKSEERERVLEGDVHALQLNKEEAKRRQDQKARGIEVQKLRDEAQRARKEEVKQQEAEAIRLLDGIQDLQIEDQVSTGRFATAAPRLYKEFSSGLNKIPHLAAMPREDFGDVMTLAVQASLFQALTDSRKDRYARSLQALEEGAWSEEGPTRVIVIAENKPGSGLTKNHILHLFRKASPGSIELNNITQLGGVRKSEATKATPAVFQVTIRSTLVQQGGVLNLLRTAHQEGVKLIEDGEGLNPVPVIITAETRWDVVVSLQSDEQRLMAQNFVKTCDALGLDKFTRDNILTSCVRRSPGLSRWSGGILWARLQREKGGRDGKITMHESDWGETKFPQSLQAPNIIINVASETVREQIAESQPSVVFYLGARPGDFITVHGMVSSRPRGQGTAGIEAARLRAMEVAKQLTSAGEDIIESLVRAGTAASAGQGRDAGIIIRECSLKSTALKDCTAKLLQGKVQHLIDALNTYGGNMSKDKGEALLHDCEEWTDDLKRVRGEVGEEWAGVIVQLKSFPDELPKVSGERSNWWRFPSTPEGLREPLQTFLTKGLEIPGILCVEPIMDAKSMWNRSEGVVVVVQRQEDFVKRCEPKQPSMEKPSLLSFPTATRVAGASKKVPKLRVLWPGTGAAVYAPNDDDAQQVKSQIRELLLTGSGLWIPKTVEVSNEPVQVFLQREHGQNLLLLSALGDARGEYDIRAIDRVLARSRDACDNVLEIIGELQRQEQVAPVCEKEGLTLFIAKPYADAFLEDPDFEADGGSGRETFTSTVRPGEDVRDEVIAQLGRTLCPLMLRKLDGGIWMLPSLKGGQMGNAMGDQEDLEPEALEHSGRRWWWMATATHVLAKLQRHDIVEMLVEINLLRHEAEAIRKAGAVLLIRKGSFWRQQILNDASMVPGHSIPTATLPITPQDIAKFEAQVFPRAAAIGSRWEETLPWGNQMSEKEVPALVTALGQRFATEIPWEVWSQLSTINHASFLKVKQSHLRPSIQGPGVIFLPSQAPLTGDWRRDLENCRAEIRSDEPPERVQIRTPAELCTTLDVTTFGVGAARIFNTMVQEGRATIKQAEGGLVVIMAERYVLDGQERSSTISQGFKNIDATLQRTQLSQSVNLQEKLNKFTMKECERQLQAFFFEQERVGVLASAQIDSQGKLCSTGTEGVLDELCLRKLIGHPSLCDSRGLEKLNDLIEDETVLARKVGKQGHHLLIGWSKSDCPFLTCNADDSRLSAWDPTREDLHALLSKWESSRAPKEQGPERQEKAEKKRKADGNGTAGRRTSKGERDGKSEAAEAMEEEDTSASYALAESMEWNSEGGVGGNSQPHLLSTFMNDEGGHEDADL